MPSISVIIPSYNYESYMYEAIKSVLLQSLKDFELIIVDDGSTDDSMAVARSFAGQDQRITVLQHPDGKNHGLAATLQLGVAESKGEYIAFLEADDIWLSTCLEQRMQVASATNAGVNFNKVEALCMEDSSTAWFDVYVPRIMRSHSRRVADAKNGPYGSYEMRGAFLIENQIPTFSCAMIRRSVLLACDLNSPIPQWVDRWLWCQAAQKATFAYIPLKLTRWRLHNNSFTMRYKPSTASKLTSFIQYIKPVSIFWKGLRTQLFSNYTRKKDRWYRYFLLLPVWGELAVRFCVQIQAIGIKAMFKTILKKLS